MKNYNYIAKIEGHGNLEIDFEKETAKLRVEEGERLFEGIVVGRKYEDIHFITPRICGVCPTAHNLASVRAIENAFGVVPTKTSIALRKVMLCAQAVQSHTLHLFFLSVPDYLGIDSATELVNKDPKLLKRVLALKNCCDTLLTLVGGRAVHPTSTRIGGFTKFPKEREIEGAISLIGKTLSDAKGCREVVRKAVGGFAPFSKATTYLALEDYYGDSQVLTSSGEGFYPKDYQENISEVVKSYSSAKYGTFQGKGFLVGALARRVLAGKTKASGNTYENNIAQAEELVELLEEAEKQLAFALSAGLRKEEAFVEFSPFESIGVGAIEAPRGTLYNKFWFDDKGVCTKADIITPTAQNLTNIEEDINAILAQNKDKAREEKIRLMEMLVRAYDPCITCSVH